MVDPVTALAGATAAFNVIKKGIQFGRDLENMANDLSCWGRACADFEFAEKQIKKPPWYSVLGGGVEAQEMAIFAQCEKLEAQRKEMREWICAMLGPSAWEELLQIEADIRKQKREHEFRRIEIKQKIIEWVAGVLLFLIWLAALIGLVLIMRSG